MLHTEGTVQMFRSGKWKTAIVVEKLNQPRSYKVKKKMGVCIGTIKNICWIQKAVKMKQLNCQIMKSEDVTNDEKRILEPE